MVTVSYNPEMDMYAVNGRQYSREYLEDRGMIATELAMRSRSLQQAQMARQPQIGSFVTQDSTGTWALATTDSQVVGVLQKVRDDGYMEVQMQGIYNTVFEVSRKVKEKAVKIYNKLCLCSETLWNDVKSVVEPTKTKGGLTLCSETMWK